MATRETDVYISADVETDGPIPGPYSMLSFGLAVAGTFDGETFRRPAAPVATFYAELKPISDTYETEALAVNGLDRDRLTVEGLDPMAAMDLAAAWVTDIAGGATPVLVAYPLSFDWTWLYWYFVRFGSTGSPFGFSRCFDVKTAIAVKGNRPIATSGHSRLPAGLRSARAHTHRAVDDALEQADILANLFEWPGPG